MEYLTKNQLLLLKITCIITHNGKTSEINIPITYSTINLYFEETKNIEKIFAELEGITKNITNIGASNYQLTDPGNHHTNTYTYDKGKLKEAIISHELFNFKLSQGIIGLFS
tara:strand:- start:209 stop:544 length:336 start_codon:yes stop_codon:yes gene_type:complete